MFSNTYKITKEHLTKADVDVLRVKYATMGNVSIKTRPVGRNVLERMNADIIITGSVAEQLRTAKLIRSM